MDVVLALLEPLFGIHYLNIQPLEACLDIILLSNVIIEMHLFGKKVLRVFSICQLFCVCIWPIALKSGL